MVLGDGMMRRVTSALVVLAVVTLAAGCSGGPASTQTAEQTPAASPRGTQAGTGATTTASTSQPRPTPTTSQIPFNEALKAPFPCNNLLVNKGDTASLAVLSFTAEQLGEYRKVIVRTCPQYLQAFDAVAPQMQQRAESAASVSASSSAALAESLSAVQSSFASRSALAADGKYAAPGAHLVGSEIQPGTWQTVATKVTDCYWEISDAQANIIDNNFLSVAPQFSVDIPDSAAGFTNSGCAFQWIG